MRYNNSPVTRRLPSESRIATLLGLTREEFEYLNCSELKALTDAKGHLIQYYIHISPFNPANVLAKLKMTNRRMIYFSPDTFETTT
jgi:hypothetical protein